MKRLITAAIAGLITAAGLPTAGAAEIDLRGPTPGGIASDNVEWIGTIPYATDTVGARLIGKHMYVNDQNKIMIFDTSDPESPELLSVIPMPQEAIYSREDIDGNDRIIAVPNLGDLVIIDVEDKSNPQEVRRITGGGQHTNSCVLDCKYSWGSSGLIVDVEKGEIVGDWSKGMPAGSGHDVTEVSPGLVLTASQPIMLLDARKNPLKPKLLATGERNLDGRYIHTSRWSQKGKDDFLLMGGETNNRAQCGDTTGAFMTWDARKWKKTRTFLMIDEYRVENGTYADGSPAVNAIGCSSHWLEPHPKFRNGGLVAAAFFEHGTRFLEINKKGKIEEIGYFMPFRGSTGAVYWRTPRILYAVNYLGGIDILKYTGDL
jgi:hypothetical protein